MIVTGWDIGGVNTKAARIEAGAVSAVVTRAFELQRAPAKLVTVLRELAAAMNVAPDSAFACALTMTAELSQMFRTKREGVAFVIDAVEAAFPSAAVAVYAVDGRFLAARAARQSPLDVAAANWSATARVVASHHGHALLVDVGTTTADIIPIVAGRVRAEGSSDPGRLASGELVYTGAVRTPVEAIAHDVPLGAATAGVSAEGFALAGDVHVWRGDLDPADYTSPTPDGRPPTREYAAERLARVVCGDRELVDEAGITAIADALAAAQADRLTVAMRRVLVRHPSIRTAVVTGLGTFLGARAAQAAGLAVVPLAAALGDPAARCAPAACVALLRAWTIGHEDIGHQAHEAKGHKDHEDHHVTDAHGCYTDLVVKLGGGLLAHPAHLEAALEAIAVAARDRPLLVVPGGGPFADAVRGVDRLVGLPDDAAHWMAVLAMDQYAQLVASRLARGVLVERPDEIRRALDARQVPVLAPSRWLRDVDPLPHTWDVTGDSIAAWVAAQVHAAELVLIKPPHAHGSDLVDRYFSRALPDSVTAHVVAADQIGQFLRPRGVEENRRSQTSGDVTTRANARSPA